MTLLPKQDSLTAEQAAQKKYAAGSLAGGRLTAEQAAQKAVASVATALAVINCRIGSLEKQRVGIEYPFWINFRIGSLVKRLA